MKYQLTDEAARDVDEILAYSVKNFGVAQTQHYFEALKECIELLADNPNMGHSAEDILPEYLRFPHEKSYDFLQKSFLINSCSEDTSRTYGSKLTFKKIGQQFCLNRPVHHLADLWTMCLIVKKYYKADIRNTHLGKRNLFRL